MSTRTFITVHFPHAYPFPIEPLTPPLASRGHALYPSKSNETNRGRKHSIGSKKQNKLTQSALNNSGGEEVLLDVGGQDGTEAFEDVGHSDEAREILDGLLVGKLKRMVRQTTKKQLARQIVHSH